MKKIEDFRNSYHKGSLDLVDILPDPLDLFRQWWLEAIQSEINEPNAMTLATVDQQGQPSARIVLLKGLKLEGFEFFTNYQSHKAHDMEVNPKVALLFFWKEMERQIRIEGTVKKVSRERSEEYFQSRPRGSQIGAWSSPQTEVILDRSVIEETSRTIESQFKDKDPLPLPEHWGGYIVRPQRYEFWQGRPDRLHDRFQYTLHSDGTWKIDRLAP